MIVEPNKTDHIPPYEGNDMTGYIMEKGFKLVDGAGSILSITNVRDTAILVTEYGIWRARPCFEIGFCIEKLAYV